jgi:tRNA (guanine37-N1)-methyltransferase
MRFDIFSLFPQLFQPYFDTSILARAIQNGLINVHLHDIRSWTIDRHHVTDDTPYGGGGGMVMKPEPVFAAVEAILGTPPACPIILMTPQGRPFNQRIAQDTRNWRFCAAVMKASMNESGSTWSPMKFRSGIMS